MFLTNGGIRSETYVGNKFEEFISILRVKKPTDERVKTKLSRS